MKKLLRKIVPAPVRAGYHATRKYFTEKSRNVPTDEQVLINTKTIYDGHFNVTYRGISAIRCPFDYVIYQIILSDLKPDLVIEIGTHVGGTALYLADLMNSIGTGTIHSIDIENHSDPKVSAHPRIKLFFEGWAGYDLENTKGFGRILVIDDASHIYEDTLGALKKFSPLVSVGSYYIVEDGIVSELERDGGVLNGGPLRAIREFLPAHRSFTVDRKYCDMFGKNATSNVNGYLKRIS